MTGHFKYVGLDKKGIKKPLFIDDKTALWLARMVVGEGGARCSKFKTRVLLNAIVNRWFLFRGARRYRSFISFVRAFSQPINPRWMTGGDLVKKYFGRNNVSKQRLARRARICAMKWEAIPAQIRVLVNMFRKGWAPMPETVDRVASNWASLPSTPKKYPWGCDVEGDWFFAEAYQRPGQVQFEEDTDVG